MIPLDKTTLQITKIALFSFAKYMATSETVNDATDRLYGIQIRVAPKHFICQV